MSNTHTLHFAFALFLAFGAARPQLAAAADTQTKATESRTEYEFDDDLIHAEGDFPEGERFQVHKPSKGDSLVRARESFVAELLRSVERL